MIKAFFIIAATLLFLDFTGTVHTYLGWVAKIQLVPAILAANIAVSLGIILLTLLFGRIYCLMICPLGIFQDAVLEMKSVKKKNRFFYRPPRKALIVLRYVLLAAFIPLINLLEPYSAYGRMVSQILGPVYKLGNNLLAYFAERAGSYAFYSVDVWLKSASTLVIAILTLVAVGISAWKTGRGYCNTICPVGAFLSLIAKFSIFKPRIDKENCTHCSVCSVNCKAACINLNLGEIDYTRCITCLRCLKVCPKKNIKYAPPIRIGANKLSKDGLARRKLLVGATLLASGFATRATANQFDGGLAKLEDKKAPVRAKPIAPPGADSYRNFHDRCTGCQLCITVCPNQVLRPGITKAQVSYERGYCRPECVKCSQVCPTGAIHPITTAEKSSIQIGVAVWNKELCIVNKDKAACDLCARKCPTAAIEMIPQNSEDPASLKFPMIDPYRCIGCGACEHLCPSRPHSAIYIEGVETHRTV